MPSAVAVDPVTTGVGTPSPTGPDLVEDIALGLELKFLLLGLPLSECAPIPRERLAEAQAAGVDLQQRQAYSAIARVVENGAGGMVTKGVAKGIAKGKVSSSDAATARLVQPRAISRCDILEAGRSERDYWPTHWIVKKANSVEHTADDPLPDVRRTNGVPIPVEMNSPTLAWTDPYAPYLVREVVSRVNTSFHAVANYTCDIHVHVGRRDGAAFALPTLKKLATVFWLAEPVLRSVRDPRSPNFGNAYTWGFEQRRCSRLARALAQRSSPTDDVNIGEELLLRVRTSSGSRAEEGDWHQYMCGTGAAAFRNEALRVIWAARSAVELGQLLSGAERAHRRLGFNFSAFGLEDERARTNPRTIEFRFLEGTLREELILGWLRICGQLVELATKGRQAQFREAVRYLQAQQPAYETLQNNADLGGGGVPVSERPGRGAAQRPSRDVLFANFMARIGVDEAAYGPFQAKIRQEYGPALPQRNDIL